MKVTIPDCGKGLNKDLLPAELELGMWSDAQNFRFRDGFAEKWEGVSKMFTPAFTSYWCIDYQNGSTNYLVYAGTLVYVTSSYTGASSSNITRPTVEQTISTLNRLGANSAEVTTSTAHGLTTGDKVTVFGATESGYNEVETTITVTSTTKFTYVTTNAIAANATVVGSYVVTSGTGTTNFASNNDGWSGGVLNGYVIFGNPTEGLFYWDGNTSNKMRKFGFTSYRSQFTDVFKNYIIQISPYMSGSFARRRVLWSSAAEAGALPSSFTASSTNDAGFVDIADAKSEVIGGKEFGDAYYVYTTNSIYCMRLIPGSSAVFSFTRTDGSGLLKKFGVANTPKGQVFITPELDIRIHNGGPSTSIIDGRLRSYLRADHTTNTLSLVALDPILTVNPRKNELWVIYTTAAGNRNILVWNWESDQWSIFTPPSDSANFIRFARSGLFFAGQLGQAENALIVTTSPDIGFAGGNGLVGTAQAGTFFGTTLTGTLERTGLHLDDRDSMKTLHRSRWNVDGTAPNTFSVYHGSSKFADTAPTYASAATYQIGTTDYTDARSTAGRFLAIKITTTTNQLPFAVRSVDLDITGGAKR